MSDLAFDERGKAIDLPAHATGWMVRRAKDGPGRPRWVYVRGAGVDDKKLVLPLSATHDDLLRAAGPGSYWLDPVDARMSRVDGCASAYAGPLGGAAGERGDEDGYEALDRDGSSGPVFQLLSRTVAANTRIAQDAVSQMGLMMGQTAQLLQSAHGLGLPSRTLHVVTDSDGELLELDEGADDDLSPRSGGIHPLIEHVIDKVVEAAVPHVMGRLAMSGVGVPPEALVDWRLAKPAASTNTSSSATPIRATARPSPQRYASGAGATFDPGPQESGPSINASVGAAGAASSDLEAAPAASSREAEVQAHVLAVWQALTPGEQATASMLIARLTPDERAAWIGELAGLTTDEATNRVRAVIARTRQPASPPAALALPAPDGDSP